VASSYTDAFILKIADDYFSRLGRAWRWHVFGTGTDSYLGDPTIDVPTIWAYSGNDVSTPHHSSADTPERVDARSLRDIATVTAAYLYYLANAEEPQAQWLATLSQTRGYQQILDVASPFLDKIAGAGDEAGLGKLLGEALDKTAYSVGRQTQAVYSVLRLLPEAQRPPAPPSTRWPNNSPSSAMRSRSGFEWRLQKGRRASASRLRSSRRSRRVPKPAWRLLLW